MVLAVRSWTGEPSRAVTGTARDADSGRAIVGARVGDEGYGRGADSQTVTDTLGRYRYLTWDEEHFVVAQADGYALQRRTLLPNRSWRRGRQVVVDFALAREQSGSGKPNPPPRAR